MKNLTLKSSKAIRLPLHMMPFFHYHSSDFFNFQSSNHKSIPVMILHTDVKQLILLNHCISRELQGPPQNYFSLNSLYYDKLQQNYIGMLEVSAQTFYFDEQTFMDNIFIGYLGTHALKPLPPENVFNLLLLESAFNDQLITTCKT